MQRILNSDYFSHSFGGGVKPSKILRLGSLSSVPPSKYVPVVNAFPTFPRDTVTILTLRWLSGDISVPQME